jgi:wyosine [tRNA(Phe)-imidazoG37] synthetase (radical SAM superfamily)
MPPLVFGPVPSRRLGRSLGINHIPPKVCSYACAYCQVGRTLELTVTPRSFYGTAPIVDAVGERLRMLRADGQPPPDYLSFVPDGEPTLDQDLGRSIAAVRPFGIPVAVISNASLIWREEARAALAEADWVSLKIDALDPRVWRKLDAPHRSLELEAILEGMLGFRESYRGALVTETMLVAGRNDGEEQLAELARFLGELRPAIAYLSIPTRPPARKGTLAPEPSRLVLAYRLLSEVSSRVELLDGYEGSGFAGSGRIEEDLLGTAAVHPLRRDAVEEMLASAGASWAVVEKLLEEERLTAVEHRGNTFYLRRFSRR